MPRQCRTVTAALGGCLLAALAALPGRPAAADGFDKTAYELYQQCDTVTSRFFQGVCLGFLGAAVVGGQAAAGEDPAFCLPDEVTPDQVRRQFIADVEADRVDGAAPAHQVVVAALATRYPCGEDAPTAIPLDPPPPEDLGLSAE